MEILVRRGKIGFYLAGVAGFREDNIRIASVDVGGAMPLKEGFPRHGLRQIQRSHFTLLSLRGSRRVTDQ